MMKINYDILSAINLLSLNEGVKKTFTQGGCYNFAQALNRLTGKGEIKYDVIVGHAYYFLDGIFYDIRGVKFFTQDYIKNSIIDEIDIVKARHKAHRWSSNCQDYYRFEVSFCSDENLTQCQVHVEWIGEVEGLLSMHDFSRYPFVRVVDKKLNEVCSFKDRFSGMFYWKSIG